MEKHYWASRGKKIVGPFASRDEALTAFRETYPFNKPLYLCNNRANSILTGYGAYGPHFDLQWHAARKLPEGV